MPHNHTNEPECIQGDYHVINVRYSSPKIKSCINQLLWCDAVYFYFKCSYIMLLSVLLSGNQNTLLGNYGVLLEKYHCDCVCDFGFSVH